MGLIQQEMQGQAPAPGQAPEQAPGQGGGREKAQQMYQKMIGMMMEFVRSDKGLDAVQEGLQMPGEPSENIGTVVARLMQKAWMDAKQQGISLPPMLVMQGAIELSQAITDLAIAAGAIEEGDANDTAKDAFYEGMTLLGPAVKGSMAPEERGKFQQLLQQLSDKDDAHAGNQGDQDSDQDDQEVLA